MPSTNRKWIDWLRQVACQYPEEFEFARPIQAHIDRQEGELSSLRKRCEKHRRDITELHRKRVESGEAGGEWALRCEVKRLREIIASIQSVLFGGVVPEHIQNNAIILHVKECAENIIAKSEGFMRERDRAIAELGSERRKITVRLSDGPCVGLFVKVPENAVLHEIEYQHGDLTTRYTYHKAHSTAEWKYLQTHESGDGVKWRLSE